MATTPPDEIVVSGTRYPDPKRLRPLKQLLAGLFESTVANAALPQDRIPYQPAIIHSLPGVVGIVRSIFTGKPNDPQGDLFDRSAARLAQATDVTNRAFGLTEPENWEEAGLRGIGTVLVPAGGAAKAVGAFTKGLFGGSKVAGKAAEIATEVALPLRNTSLKTAVPVAGGLSVGLTELADTALQDNPNYTSVLGDNLGLGVPRVPKGQGQMTPEEAHAQLLEEQERAQERQSRAVTTIVVGSAAALGFRQLVNAAKNSIIKRPSVVGQGREETLISADERIATDLIDQSTPIRVILDKAAEQGSVPAQEARRIDHLLDFVSNSAIGSRVEHFLFTGEVGARRYRAVAPILEAMASELTDEQFRKLSTVQLYLTSLDDRRRLGVGTKPGTAPSFSDMTNAQLEGYINEAMQDPLIAKYVGEFRNIWDDMISFAEHEGLITAKRAREMRQHSPNYAEMARSIDELWPDMKDTLPTSANRPPEIGTRRSEEPFGGVQAGSVAPPAFTIANRWSSLIRSAHVNRIRRGTLELLDGKKLTKDGPPVVQRVEKLHDPTMGHTVYVNGKPVTYLVRDPDLRHALHFYPRVANEAFNWWREAYQATITGPLGTLFNGFSLFKSPIYDAAFAALSAPQGVEVGLINRVLGGIHPKLTLGVGDPTMYISGFLGAVPHMFDSIMRDIGQHFATHVVRHNSWLRDVIGADTTQALADYFSRAYLGSIKALMDRTGISSSTLPGAADPLNPTTGLHRIAPRFSNLQARAAWEAALKNDETTLQQFLAASKITAHGFNTWPLVRLYVRLIDAAHNGFRHWATASKSNLQNAADLEEFMARMRRLSPDPSIHGAQQSTVGKFVWGPALDAVPYMSIGVQSLRRIAQLAQNDPERFLNRIILTTVPILAAYVHARVIDEDTNARAEGMSIEQKLTNIPLWGGLDLPVSPELTPVLGLMLPLVDQLAGFDTGEYNPDFIRGMFDLLDGETSNQILDDKIARGLEFGARRINPFDFSSMPVANAIIATLGGNAMQSRLTGEFTPVKPQNITGLDADDAVPGGAITDAFTQNLIVSLTGQFGAAMMTIANDVARTHGDPSWAIAERYKDIFSRSAGPARPILFPDWQSRTSAISDARRLADAKTVGIEVALQVANEDWRNPMGRTGRVAQSGQAQALNAPPLDERTKIVVSEAMAYARNNTVARIKSRMKHLTELSRRIDQQYGPIQLDDGTILTTIKQKNAQVRLINDERRRLAEQLLAWQRHHEEQVRIKLDAAGLGGLDFVWEQFAPTTEDMLEAPRQ